jgi:hypothetical protein
MGQTGPQPCREPAMCANATLLLGYHSADSCPTAPPARLWRPSMTIHPSREPQAGHQGPASTVSPSGSCTPSPFVGSAVAVRSARSALTGTFQRPNTFTARSSSASWRFSRFSSVPWARPRMRAASRKGTCNSGRLTQCLSAAARAGPWAEDSQTQATRARPKGRSARVGRSVERARKRTQDALGRCPQHPLSAPRPDHRLRFLSRADKSRAHRGRPEALAGLRAGGNSIWQHSHPIH